MWQCSSTLDVTCNHVHRITDGDVRSVHPSTDIQSHRVKKNNPQLDQTVTASLPCQFDGIVLSLRASPFCCLCCSYAFDALYAAISFSYFAFSASLFFWYSLLVASVALLQRAPHSFITPC